VTRAVILSRVSNYRLETCDLCCSLLRKPSTRSAISEANGFCNQESRINNNMPMSESSRYFRRKPGSRHCELCTRSASRLHKTLCTVHTVCFPASQDTVNCAHGLLPGFTRHCALCTRSASRLHKTPASTSSAENHMQ